MVLGQTDASQRIPKEFFTHGDRLVGDWSVELEAGSQKYEARYSAKWATVGGEKPCIMWNWQDDQGYKSAAISGWDASTKEVVDLIFGTDGHHIMTRFRVDKTWNVWEGTSTGFLDGGKFADKRRVEWISHKEFHFLASKTTIDGKPQPDVKAVFRKK